MVGVAGPSLETLSHEQELRLQGLVPRNYSGKFKIETEVLVGSAAAEIANFAREKMADLIVVGTHGRKGLTRMLLGSTAEALLRRAPCQVLVVKPKMSPHVPDTIAAPGMTDAT